MILSYIRFKDTNIILQGGVDDVWFNTKTKELIIVDSKTGISGAGRTAKEAFGFSELNDNCAAYGTKGHRICMELQ